MPAPLPLPLAAIQRRPAELSPAPAPPLQTKPPAARAFKAVAGVFVLSVLTYAVVTQAAVGKDGPVGEKRLYDANGAISVLELDANHDGRSDSWTFFDHGKRVRMEVDEDGDGVVDRWYYYSADESLARVGATRTDSRLYRSISGDAE